MVFPAQRYGIGDTSIWYWGYNIKINNSLQINGLTLHCMLDNKDIKNNLKNKVFPIPQYGQIHTSR